MVTSIRNGLAASMAAKTAALASAVDQLDEMECVTEADGRLIYNVRSHMTSTLATMADLYRELSLIRDHAALGTFNASDRVRMFERIDGLFLDVEA